ncbi:MAG: hypothetical protein KatS3mg020_0505 [Fimbriimonadales bacterium]|nr:MAG: hypothetical protein KatS3mg020_0505 [Fimbriimonadales bacterium]
MVTGADVSDARGAYGVLDGVLGRYRSVSVVIADRAYDWEGLLVWLLGKWEVGLDCVGRLGCGGFVLLACCWLVERVFAWFLCCRRLSRCDDVLCAVEEAWIWLSGIRRLMRYFARNDS